MDFLLGKRQFQVLNTDGISIFAKLSCVLSSASPKDFDRDKAAAVVIIHWPILSIDTFSLRIPLQLAPVLRLLVLPILSKTTMFGGAAPG